MKLLGNILIAPPSVKGNFWYKTVVLVSEHHSQGSVGFVLNKRSQMSIKDFGEQLGFDLDLPGFVYVGGPVNVKSMTLLHTNEWTSTNTMRINDELSMSSAEDILPRMAMGDVPRKWRLFLGLCGWQNGQLESEIKGIAPYTAETSWCTSSASLDLVFESDNKDQWCNALDRSGLEFAQNILA